MQEVYSITVKRPVEIEEKYMRKSKKSPTGKIEATRKKVIEEETEVVFIRPNASMREEADFFFGQQYNRLISAGYLTRAMVMKKFQEVGGIGVGDSNEFKESLGRYLEAYRVIEFLTSKEKRTEEEEKKLKEAREDFADSEKSISEFQRDLQAQYSQTADAKAEQKLVEWLLLFFLYTKEKNGDKIEYFPFFPGQNYEEKRERWLELQEEINEDTPHEIIKRRDILTQCFEKMVQVISLWHSGLGKNQSEIDEGLKNLYEQYQ